MRGNKLIYLASLFLLVSGFTEKKCDDILYIIRNLSGKEVIKEYPRLFNACSEACMQIPATLPLKNLSSARITSLFGYRKHPIKGVEKHHGGLDIACNKQEVIATASGIVSKTGYNNGLGYFVEINHLSTYKTIYGHLSEIWAKQGEKVIVGESIGVAGSTGLATGVHIHYEVHKDDVKQNPIDYIILFYSKIYQNQ